MGFFAMVGAMLLGIFCIAVGIPIGIALVLFAIYLGFPK